MSSLYNMASERLFMRILDQLLGPYVQDLTRDKLRGGVGVWSGNLVLTDLALREDALDGRARSCHHTAPDSGHRLILT